MTSEQIAELRKGYEERSRDDLAAEADEVLKLLDEREALLEALRAAVDALEIAGEGRFHQDALRAACDAIAKAESP